MCVCVYILVIRNIMNKSLFMQVKIAKNLLLFSKITTIFLYKSGSIALHLKVIFYYNLYKYIF